MKPAVRKLVRTAHVTITVGWLGSVVSFLILAISGLTSRDNETVRAAYLSMDLMARFGIVPMSIAPLVVTGPLLSLGTAWGLFRHYWIIVKLVINILSTGILLVHLRPMSYLAHTAAAGSLSSADRSLQIQMVVAAAGGLLALLAATALAVYKPRGMTTYAWRKQYQDQEHSDPGI